MLVKAADAHHDIAFSCLAYLVSSFQLIDNHSITEQQKVIGVGKSFHGLHLYANEYWLRHFILYADARRSCPEGLSRPLIDLLVVLVAANNTSSAMTRDSTIQWIDYSASPLPESISISLRRFPGAARFILRMHGFHEGLKKEQNKNGAGR